MKGKAGTIRKVALAAMCVAGLAAASSASAASRIVVSDVAGLQNALASAHAGDRIVMRPGTYQVGATLDVRDGVSLEGSGVMQGGKLPTGFKSGTETRIVALSTLQGDVVTLGDGSSLRALSIKDAADRIGNVISARSRKADDSITASILECEIVNPNGPGGDLEGPSGFGIVVFTRNPHGAAAPAPHTGAAVAVSVSRTIVHSTGGAPAIFAVNSAPGGRLDVDLTENVIGGRLDVAGGASRGDEVTGASVTIDSTGNLYAPVDDFAGWTVMGGSSTPPAPVFPAGPGASSNHVTIDSTDDRIEGTPVGIQSFGSRRFDSRFGPNNDNRVDLNVSGLTLETLDGGSDFVLAGAVAFGPFTPGDRNTVSVLMRDTTGSGLRGNYYDNPNPVPGVGNRLEFVGTAAAFAESNDDIDPAPGDGFFVG